jgi:hypothetical protein
VQQYDESLEATFDGFRIQAPQVYLTFSTIWLNRYQRNGRKHV